MEPKKLKILLVYYEPFQSGQTAHVLSLVQGLERHEYALTIVLPDFLKPAIEKFHQSGVQVYPLPIRKLVWQLEGVKRYFDLIRHENFDIVHIHSQEAGLTARILTLVAGKKHIVYTPQTIDIRNSHLHWLYVLIERILSTKTDRIISVNEIDRERLISWGIPAKKVVTIYNGIDLSQFDVITDILSIRERLGLYSSSPLVMQIGRLSVQKDPFAFIDGAAMVLNKHPKTQFVMVGDGPLREDVETHIQALGLEKQIKLSGWQQDAFKLIPAADIVTLTSRWEGTPYSLLEAMAWSKPVISYKVNGCSEVVEDTITGFLVPVGATNTWASCIVELLEDPEMGRIMGNKGRQRVESKFSICDMTNQIGILYDQVVK